jgi:hypothetical protein
VAERDLFPNITQNHREREARPAQSKPFLDALPLIPGE